MFGHGVRRTAGSFWMSSCESDLCWESSPVSSILAPVVREGAAAPAGPVVPGGPHEDRAVLEQAMDDQPMDEERARGFANPNRPDEETVERHNLTPSSSSCMVRHLRTVPTLSSSQGDCSEEKCNTRQITHESRKMLMITRHFMRVTTAANRMCNPS